MGVKIFSSDVPNPRKKRVCHFLFLGASWPWWLGFGQAFPWMTRNELGHEVHPFTYFKRNKKCSIFMKKPQNLDNFARI